MKKKWIFFASIPAVCTAFLIGAIIAGCSGGGGGGGGDAPMPEPELAKLNAQLDSYPSWDEFAANEEDFDEPVDDPTAYVSGEVLCTMQPYSITQNPEEIVTFGSAPDILYLGSLIQGDTYLGGLGSLEELPIRQRAPLTIAITIFTENPGNPVTCEVEDPNAASVQQALSDLIGKAVSGYEPDDLGAAYFKKTESYSSEQMSLSLGVSYKYMGSSAKASMAYDTSEEEHTITAYYKQVMFEAYIVRPQTPAEFFSTDFTQERLDEQIDQGNIGPDNLPVYVSRIQYGRILMYSMTSTASMENLKLAAQYGYDGVANVDVDVQAEIEKILNESEIKVVAIGGSDKGLRECLISGNLEAYFESGAPLTSAKPISYALCNLADGSLAVVSETTEYVARQCEEASFEYYLDKTQWDNAVNDLIGEDKILYFATTATNLALSNEEFYDGDKPPTPNTHMGPILTFEKSKTGYPFDFYLEAPGDTYGLTYRDNEGVPLFQEIGSISIGDVDNEEDDNFRIGILNWADGAVFAIGTYVGDNDAAAAENVLVQGVKEFADGQNQVNVWLDSPQKLGFLGIVSTTPLLQIYFDEGSGGDDILVKGLYFGVLVSD